ncbi:LAMI_0H00628g1_1 [Lachancea mirantina]|uniref:oxaloacetate tautomerase n=1 Tax=Lachancea mirantina TaxID=1230905 RepID=A0A1G4KDH2_9SACH|nr:LAMI_0H00628g1_1 [Lachancea mirantina]
MSFNYLKSARKVVCIGRNYAAHIKELNNPTPKQPFYFLKPTSSIVTPVETDDIIPRNETESVTYAGLRADGSNPGPIYIPKGVKVHHEVELALIMGRNVSNATPESVQADDVYDLISGVALALDLTARNVQDEAKAKGLPWSIGKGFDSFLPISDFIPKSQLSRDDFQNSFRLTCSVNNKGRQDGTTDLMLNPLHAIIQHISSTMSLEPGDIVLTGTPAGVGEIGPGDTIKSALYQNGKLLTSFKFDCKSRPGPYVFHET